MLNTENRRLLTGGILLVEDDNSGIVMVWAFGLGEPGMSTEPVRRNPESEIDEMRLWALGRVAPEPVNGVNDCLLLEAGVAKDVNDVRVVSTDILAWLIRRFSVCNRINPRLVDSQITSTMITHAIITCSLRLWCEAY